MQEVMLRRKKEEVLELPAKIRSWVPVSVESAAALNAQRSFAEWFAGSDASRPNDKDFLARLTKVRVALHKAKHRAVEERIRDVISTNQKVIAFTAFTEGLKKHKAVFGDQCVTISGADNAEQRMEAVDRFQNDPELRVAVCNIIAGGVGITLTAGTHVIFQDLDWVPANLLQAEDRAHRLGQTGRVTVEYMFADGTLDVFIAELLEGKLCMIEAVESDEMPHPCSTNCTPSCVHSARRSSRRIRRCRQREKYVTGSRPWPTVEVFPKPWTRHCCRQASTSSGARGTQARSTG
jgi:SWI/SNF-related matrix-associated actin-dependent regulator 1 of chromatin subfamily A